MNRSTRPSPPRRRAPVPVWVDRAVARRNDFALFRIGLRLPEVPARPVVFHLFADTRYRLRVNGRVIGIGPARFMRARPEYDSWDLTPGLQPGDNCITVEVNSFGCATFEAEPSTAAFIAWSSLHDDPLRTPGRWLARRIDAWDRWAPRWSFAQPPSEILDVGGLEHAWFLPGNAGQGWTRPAALAPMPHRLEPRSCPMPQLSVRSLGAPVRAARIASEETRIGFRVDEPKTVTGNGDPLRIAYATFLWSPSSRKVPLSLFWGPHFLNGVPLSRRPGVVHGNREVFDAPLRHGWNLLYGEPEFMRDSWGLLLGWPANSGIRAATDPSVDATEGFRRLDPLPESELRRLFPSTPASLADLAFDRLPWRMCVGPIDGHMPAREIGWDRPLPPTDPPPEPPWNLPAEPNSASVMLFDNGTEFLGNWIVDVETDAPLHLDIATDDWIVPNGFLRMFRDQFEINCADRLILPPGRHQVEGFRTRGGRYLQLTTRCASRAPAVCRLHSVSIRSRLARITRQGAFACSDALLTWAWNAGADTLLASCEDAFVDPWRERAVYVGDTVIQQQTLAVLSTDLSLARRCLANWGLSLRPDHLINDNAPSGHTKALADYSLLWIRLLHDYWSLSGDLGLARECWTAVSNVLASPVWRRGSSGLIDASGVHHFIDWAVPADAKMGESSSLNAFMILALRSAQRLANALGDSDAARSLERSRRTLTRSFQQLWSERHGCYLNNTADRAGARHNRLHGNIAALLAGAVPRRKRAILVRTVLSRLRSPEIPPPIELYFAGYLLEVLASEGTPSEALEVVRTLYAPMREAGAPCLWETLADGIRGHGSLCHGWSTAPTHLLSREILGVRPSSGSTVIVSPHDGGLRWAAGSVPHPAGPIDVSWRIRGKSLLYKIVAPRGIRIVFRPRGRLANLVRVPLSPGCSEPEAASLWAPVPAA